MEVQKRHPMQRTIVSLAVKHACIDIGLDYNRKQMEAEFKRLAEQGHSVTGRITSPEPQFQEFPK